MSETATPITHDAQASGIVNNSSWFPYGLDLRDEVFEFVQTDEQSLLSEAFVSQATWNPVGSRRKLSIAATIANWPERAPANANFLWHTGFCASTLISRALDKTGKNLSLREPDALTVLADVKRARLLTEPQYQRLPQTTFGLLSRPLAAEGKIMIKGSPASAVLIPEAMQLTSGKMLFLYSDCRSFLIAVARGGEARRAFVRRLFNSIAGDGHEQNTWPTNRIFAMSDLQIAALVWHMQMSWFRRMVSALGDRAVTLDCDAFLKAPQQTIARLDDFFGLGLGEQHAEDAAGGGLMQQHAKTGGDVAGAWEHWTQSLEIDGQLAKEIETLNKWGYERCNTPPGVPLPNALMPIEKSYTP